MHELLKHIPSIHSCTINIKLCSLNTTSSCERQYSRHKLQKGNETLSSIGEEIRLVLLMFLPASLRSCNKKEQILSLQVVDKQWWSRVLPCLYQITKSRFLSLTRMKLNDWKPYWSTRIMNFPRPRRKMTSGMSAYQVWEKSLMRKSRTYSTRITVLRMKLH